MGAGGSDCREGYIELAVEEDCRTAGIGRRDVDATGFGREDTEGAGREEGTVTGRKGAVENAAGGKAGGGPG